MIHIYTEIHTSYIPDEDTTIVWQDMYKTDDKEVECIQRALIGWYCGEPNDDNTAHYAYSHLIGNYVDCEN